MNSTTVLIIILCLVIFILFIIKTWINNLQNLFSDISRRIDTSSSEIDQRLSRNLELFAQVQRSIGEFSEIGRSMQDLQQFLQSPKLRGDIGEQILKELLTQYLPSDTYKLQYSFRNGEKVDAIIKTSQGLLPIDSKFPMGNFRRLMDEKDGESKEKIRKEFVADVKKHIQDIAKKYILVTEGTLDYALMYIPSESVYYEIINNNELFDFAGSKRILPVSPMSFYAYMKAILMSFEGVRIQTQTKEILNILRAIKKDYEKSDEALSILNKHISNAYNQSVQVSKNFQNLGQKLTSSNLISDNIRQKELIE